PVTYDRRRENWGRCATLADASDRPAVFGTPNKAKSPLAMTKLLTVSLIAVFGVSAQEYTRGIGVYPGDPKQYFGPSMQVDATSYRNLALHRPAWHSSSYDFN